MASLPTGTVTFLFTDIEGSTRLLQSLGDAGFALVLASHREILRGAFDAVGGHEIETQGDGFLVAFQSARKAIAAALAAQRALAAHPWPDGAPLRVRMGFDTAEATIHGGAYAGMGLHRAARICATGWGGQILLSRTTAGIVEPDLPAGAALRDLGDHHLKDLQRTERIYQLLHADLPAEFPPLRSLDSLPNNLPRYLTSFIGREREIADVKRWLTNTRLLMLTGSGGCGKTRLALQVGADLVDGFRDGVWLVELAPISDPVLVPQTVASTLHIREEPGRPLLVTLTEHLGRKQMLLLLDNCEHVVEACAHLAERMLRACPHLRILATSREPLAIPGETTWRVPSLSAPDPLRLPPPESLTQYEAVRLFVERAVAARPDFTVTERNAPAVAQVCHQLDGIPLAIELAAARVKVLPVNQIADRLNDHFRLLTGGGRTSLPHHQTLEAAMDWSYDLLPAQERTVLCRLSVFAGGWTLEVAEAVCAGDGVEPSMILDLLAQLVDKSLVMARVHEGPVEGRYWLQEPVRQYAARKLREAGEEETAIRRHWEYFVDLVEHSSLRGPDQASWTDRLTVERDNLRAALERSKKREGGADATLRLAASLWWFWFTQGTLTEGRAWLETALAVPGATTPAARAAALYGAGAIAWNQGDLTRAAELAGEALDLCRELDDRIGVIYSLSILSIVRMFQGEYARTTAMAEEALVLCRELGYHWETATVLGVLGWAAQYQGEFERAEALCTESLGIFRSIGDRWGAATVLSHLGNVTWRQGRHARARELLEESIGLARDLGHRSQLAISLHEMARLVHAQGDADQAAILEIEALALRKDQGEMWGIAECLEGLAAAAQARGSSERAVRLLGAAAALRDAIGVPLPAADLPIRDGVLAAAQTALGGERFVEAMSQGRATMLAQVLEDALGARAQSSA
ncbi:MAG: tetratricopeptide repeat protein [bacterium]